MKNNILKTTTTREVSIKQFLQCIANSIPTDDFPMILQDIQRINDCIKRFADNNADNSYFTGALDIIANTFRTLANSPGVTDTFIRKFMFSMSESLKA